MSIFKYLIRNKNFINLIFYRGLGSGLGMLFYILVLGFFGNYFALAHSGFVTSYQVGQAGCTFERNLSSKSALKTFFQNIYLRFIFSFLWLLILYFVFEIELYFICFIGFFISFIYLIHFDKHTKFIKKSSFILSMVPLVTIASVSLFFYFFPISLGHMHLINSKFHILISLIILFGAFIIGFLINKNNKFFVFEILYSSIPIFILSFLVKNQINEKITFYIIIFYKVLEFIYAGCYFALTGTKKIKTIIQKFFLIEKFYTIFLITLIPIIFTLFENNEISIILVLWIFLFRTSSFLLLSYEILISSIYIVYSILLIYFFNYLNIISFISLLILPNLIIIIFQKKMDFTNFVNLKT